MAQESIGLKQFAAAVFLIASVVPGIAFADTITFSTAIGGIFTGPTVEGDFRYVLFSGGSFLDPVNGDPDEVMQGLIAAEGGTLQIVLDAGGQFKFDQATVQQFSFGAVLVAFEGYLGGVLQATDLLLTSSSNLVFTTLPSVNLNGVTIDELRVILDASSTPIAYEGVDNIVVNKVPEPTSIALVAAGLIALYARGRIRGRE